MCGYKLCKTPHFITRSPHGNPIYIQQRYGWRTLYTRNSVRAGFMVLITVRLSGSNVCPFTHFVTVVKSFYSCIKQNSATHRHTVNFLDSRISK